MRFGTTDLIPASFCIQDNDDGGPTEKDDPENMIIRQASSASSINPDDLSLPGEIAPIQRSSSMFTFITLNSSVTHGNSYQQMASMAASGVKNRFHESLTQSVLSESLLKDYDDRLSVAPFNIEEIVLGKKLGSGEFSYVYKVKSFRLKSLICPVSKTELDMRRSMKDRVRYRNTNRSRYALKHLKPDLVDKYEPEEYAQFASDLVQEAEFLSIIQHPNVIKLRGTSFGNAGFGQSAKDYFLIIDRLDGTLEHRIARWKKGVNRRNSLLKSIIRKNSDASDSSKDSSENILIEERLEVLIQIAAALVYLHEKNIIYRDLKPANIGFDLRGDVKLFDLGLARMMPPHGDPYNDSFKMSGAGSPRYMAPEVMNYGSTYNLKADVYTYGILMWEVLSLHKPFAFITSKAALVDYVGKRRREQQLFANLDCAPSQTFSFSVLR